MNWTPMSPAAATGSTSTGTGSGWRCCGSGTNDLGNDFRMNPIRTRATDPSGPVIDFIMAASVNAVHQGQRTPQAVRDFIRRTQEKGCSDGQT